jgi:L-gulono-1,4-lactone dehydrogenase
MWRNWSGEQECRPAVVERPGSVAEVQAAVRRARETGMGVRVAGAGHSFTPAVLTDGMLLDVGALSGVLDADRERGLVRFGAGTTIARASEELARLGLAFENLGDINVQTLAGATATATHGTGSRLANISAQLDAVELVAAEGGVVRCSREDDPDAWRAARVSLGALGVITAVTVRAVPQFTLRRVDARMPLDEVLDGLDEHADGAPHFELFTFPYTGVALTRTTHRVDGPPAPPGAARRWLQDIAINNGVLGAVCGVGRRVPRLVPALNRAVTRAAGGEVRLDRSDRCFASPRLVRFTEMEYALPRAAAATFVREVLALIEGRRLMVNFPLELRFVAADDAFLSPASGRETAYVAVHAYRGMDWSWFRDVERLADAHGGRPHWGKRHFQTSATLAPRYERWDDFQAVRARLDPDGLFTNDYVARTLGPPTGPPTPPASATTSASASVDSTTSGSVRSASAMPASSSPSGSSANDDA